MADDVRMPSPPPEPAADPSLWTNLTGTYVYAGPHGDYCRCSVQCGKGSWHTQPIGSPWRMRDKLARLLQFHCWDCWRRDAQQAAPPQRGLDSPRGPRPTPMQPGADPGPVNYDG